MTVKQEHGHMGTIAHLIPQPSSDCAVAEVSPGLTVRWQRFLQVVSHSETEGGTGLLFMDFRLQLKAFHLIKTVYGWEGERHFA